MIPEELLKLAHEILDAGAGLSAGALAEGYLALSVQLEEQQQAYRDELKDVQRHLEAAEQETSVLKEMLDNSYQARRELDAQIKDIEASRGEVVQAFVGSNGLVDEAALTNTVHAILGTYQGGEVVKACPQCGAQANQSERTGVNPAWTHLPGWRPWFCGDCKREYDEPAYWQRVERPK